MVGRVAGGPRHLPAIAALEEAELVAVYTAREETAKREQRGRLAPSLTERAGMRGRVGSAIKRCSGSTQ
jgi:hypothetical protein